MRTLTYIRYGLTIACLLVVFSFNSCTKFVEVDLPKSQLASQAVFENDATANSVLSAMYTSSFGWSQQHPNCLAFLALLSADEADSYLESLAFAQFANNQLISTNSYLSILWNETYHTIYRCNTLIEGVTDNNKISEKVRKQIIGEALFFRALGHLTVTNLFGAVPIVDTTDYRINTALKKSESSIVLKAVIADLLVAKELLPADYKLYGNERIRPNKYAILALLARTYLYLEDWDNAEKASTEVLSNTTLFEMSALNEVFLKNSRESIFQYKTTSTQYNSYDGQIYILTGKPTWIALKLAFYESFEAGDLRKSNWIEQYVDGTETYYYPFKYKVKLSPIVTEYFTFFRLAEQYLIRAEARAKQNKLSLAIEDLDVVRFRAGLPKIGVVNPGISQPDLLNQIFQERKSELFTEWGHRWIDLRRTGKLDETLSAIKPDWKSTAAFFPLPQAEINVNVNLEQNLGY